MFESLSTKMTLCLFYVLVGVVVSNQTLDPTCDITHWIRIGKTGSTTTKKVLKEINLPHSFRIHGHAFALGDGKENDCYTFFVRDPVDRWVSGFMSRLRLGCPAHCHVSHQQKTKEAELFFKYPTPNDLAEALNTTEGRLANEYSFHTKRTFQDYLPIEAVKKAIREKKITFVGEMSQFEQELNRLILTLDPESTRIPLERAHANPTMLRDFIKLSPLGRCHLEDFLEKDYQVLEMLYDNGLIKEKFERQCNDEHHHQRRLLLQRPKLNLKGSPCQSCEEITKHVLNHDLYVIRT